jgi:hypothetical protein
VVVVVVVVVAAAAVALSVAVDVDVDHFVLLAIYGICEATTSDCCLSAFYPRSDLVLSL